MDRSGLHRLVEKLPEAAFGSARAILDRLQVWPPKPPPARKRIQEIGQEQTERFRRSRRRGTGGGVGFGRIVHRPGYGHSSHSRIEDGAVAVMESCHLYNGHEIAVVERLRLIDDGKSIHYTHEIKGPKGDMHVNEIEFDLG